MNDASAHIRSNLAQMRMMQLATVRDNKPWICTVYYIEDDGMNLYWLSLPTRRHSLELADNPQVAAAIAVKFDTQPIIGMQVEGRAEAVNDLTTIKAVMKKYVDKYDKGQQFYDNFLASTNQHRMYRLVPRHITLFDEVNYPGQPQNINL
jgi:uncharacterized protein YhbP (UPF0306 family)